MINKNKMTNQDALAINNGYKYRCTIVYSNGFSDTFYYYDLKGAYSMLKTLADVQPTIVYFEVVDFENF